MGGVMEGEGIDDGLVVVLEGVGRRVHMTVGLSEAAAVVVIEEEQQEEIRRGRMISWPLILTWRTC